MIFTALYQTDFGTGSVSATGVGVCRVQLPGDSAATGTEPSPLAIQVAGLLKRYFAGEPISFRDIPLDVSLVSEFRRSIVNVVRAIPYGRTMSYGQVAALAGRPSAARAVGGAMAANQAPIVIPCHRVVGADGRMTGFSAPGGVEMKSWLLAMERAAPPSLPAVFR